MLTMMPRLSKVGRRESHVMQISEPGACRVVQDKDVPAVDKAPYSPFLLIFDFTQVVQDVSLGNTLLRISHGFICRITCPKCLA